MLEKDKVIKVGSKIKYRGCFGMDAPTIVTVEHIERSKYKRSKDGEVVPEIAFAERDYGVFCLDNSHWCYGEQIDDVIDED